MLAAIETMQYLGPARVASVAGNRVKLEIFDERV